jgi:cell division protein DivIC
VYSWHFLLYLIMEVRIIKPYLGYLKNKYVVVTLAFVVWMAFFDPKDIGLILSRTSKLKELKTSEKHLKTEILDTKKELGLLKTDAASIEKYARENFYMKKDNEELFIVKIP